MFEFCGKPRTALNKNFIFCIFCLTENELVDQLHLKKYIENEFFYPASQKIKQKDQKHNPTS